MRALTWGHMRRFYTQGRLDVTVGGHETRNEMCLNYLIYYPKINLGSCFAKADWEGTIKSFAKLLVPRRPLPFADRPAMGWEPRHSGMAGAKRGRFRGPDGRRVEQRLQSTGRAEPVEHQGGGRAQDALPGGGSARSTLSVRVRAC